MQGFFFCLKYEMELDKIEYISDYWMNMLYYCCCNYEDIHTLGAMVRSAKLPTGG